MIKRYILDARGEAREEPDLMTWARWFETSSDDTRRIGSTDVGDASVSTVFLAAGYSPSGGQPLIFETMIFGGDHDQYQIRYATRAEAEVGHQAVVDALRSGGELP